MFEIFNFVNVHLNTFQIICLHMKFLFVMLNLVQKLISFLKVGIDSQYHISVKSTLIESFYDMTILVEIDLNS
jgi:hypothetical protein